MIEFQIYDYFILDPVLQKKKRHRKPAKKKLLSAEGRSFYYLRSERECVLRCG